MYSSNDIRTVRQTSRQMKQNYASCRRDASLASFTQSIKYNFFGYITRRNQSDSQWKRFVSIPAANFATFWLEQYLNAISTGGNPITTQTDINVNPAINTQIMHVSLYTDHVPINIPIATGEDQSHGKYYHTAKREGEKGQVNVG